MKRAKVATLVAQYDNNISKGVAFAILSQAEVQDALNFASTGSAQFANILAVMRENDIWRFWFQRDLKIVLDKFKDVGRMWFNVNVVEGPLWKVMYLWWRLVMSAYQWHFLQNERILDAYPPGSRVRYVRLNEMDLSTAEGATLYLDFRIEFVRMAINLRRFKPQYAKEIEYSGEYLDLRRGYEKTAFFREKFPAMVPESRQIFEDIYFDMIDALTDTYRPTFSLRAHAERVNRPPRVVERTLLMVTSCLTCGAQAQVKEKTNDKNTFCNKTCQRCFHCN